MDYRTLGDVLYFYFALNTTAGTGSDATGTPTFQVREGGASSSAAPTLTGNATLLSHASHVDGCYEIAITASSGNGFTTGKQYGVFCTAAVSSVNPTGYLGSFILAAVRTDIAAAPSAVTIAAAVWDYLTSAISTAGSIGKLLKDNIDAVISSRLASASYTAPDNATISSTASAVNAVGVIVTAIQAIFTGMTSLPNWLRVMSRKDVGTAGMDTAQTEMNTGGTATFTRTTDSLEGNYDKSVTISLSPDDIEDIADGVVAGIQAIPGFSVEVVSPVDDTGTIQVTQGDAYLAANSRNIAIELTGSLPSIEAVCTLRVFFGGTVTEYTGSRTVNSATSITLKFDLTGVQTAAMPVGTFQYEAEVTYASTSNKWTPSTGKFIVKGQL